MSRKGALVGFVVALVAGAIALVVTGVRADSVDRATTGDFPAESLVTLKRPADQVCQRPVALPPGVDRVRLVLAPGAKVRGPVQVTIRRLDTRGMPAGAVAGGTLSRRQLTGRPQDVRLDATVRRDMLAAVCVTQTGPEPLQVWGQSTSGATTSASDAYLGRRPIGGDLYLEFPQPRPRSVLSQVPEAFRRAATFKIAGLGAWAYWGLAGLLLIAVAGLGDALRRAAAQDDGDGG